MRKGDSRFKAFSFKALSLDAKESSETLRSYVKDLTDNTRDPLKKLPSKLNDLFTHIDATLEDAKAVVKNLTDQVTDPRLQQSIQETTELTRTTLARFNQIASDLHQLTGDPKLQNDLKQTVENLRNITE